jgi:hypothetical protein
MALRVGVAVEEQDRVVIPGLLEAEIKFLWSGLVGGQIVDPGDLPAMGAFIKRYRNPLVTHKMAHQFKDIGKL